MIDLTGELSLGSVVLSRDSDLSYTYYLPRGMTFTAGATVSLRFTDRSGGEYDNSPFAGTISTDRTKATWTIDSLFINPIPAGANFEVFVVDNSVTYKVRYGRVVRKEVSFPLNPLNVEVPPLMYEDDMQRSMPGPRWLIKGGRMSMQAVTGITNGVSYSVGTGMATRNTIEDIWGNSLNLYTKAAAQWYGPLQSDAIEMNIGLADNGYGTFTAVFASNYSMTKWLGVRFFNQWTLADGLGASTRRQVRIQVVYGSAWDTSATVGSYVNYTMSSSGSMFKIVYSGQEKTVSVFTPASATVPALNQISTSSTAAQTGAGYRYLGVTSAGDFAYSGPRLYYWKVKDTV